MFSSLVFRRVFQSIEKLSRTNFLDSSLIFFFFLMLELFDKVFITKFRAAMNRKGLSDIFAVILLEITLSDLRLQKILLIR